jgi:hypothetical protein
MKYTIEGFSQQVALEYGFDVKDLVFLRWLVDFYSTGIMEKHVIDGEEYTWLSYRYVIEQIPMLGITSSDALGRRLKGLAAVLELRVTALGGGGNKTCFRFKETAMVRLLSSKAPDSKVGCHPTRKSGGCRPKSRVQYDSSISDSSINDSKAFRPSAAVESALKRVHDQGFNIRPMIIKYHRKKKLKNWPTDTVILEVCHEYLNPKKPIKNTYGWFTSVLHYKICRHGAAKSEEEHQNIKKSLNNAGRGGTQQIGEVLKTMLPGGAQR